MKLAAAFVAGLLCGWFGVEFLRDVADEDLDYEDAAVDA